MASYRRTHVAAAAAHFGRVRRTSALRGGRGVGACLHLKEPLACCWAHLKPAAQGGLQRAPPAPTAMVGEETGYVSSS